MSEERQGAPQVGDTPAGNVLRGAAAVHRLTALQELSGKIDGARSHDEIFQVLRAEGKRLFDDEVCLAGVLNRAGTHYVVSTLSPVADASDLNHKYFGVDEGTPGWVTRNQAAVVDDMRSAPSFSHSLEGKLEELGIKSLLVVPMRTGEGIAGSLLFGSVRPRRYAADDAALAGLLAGHIAGAMRNSSILEDARKRLSQIVLINEVTSRLASVLKLDELLNAAATSIQKNFNYFDVTVFLLSPDRKELVLEAHAGNFVDFLPHGYRQKAGSGIVGWVVAHGERVLSNDVSQDPRYMSYEYHNTRSELAIPIVIDGVVAGVLNVEDTKLHAFDETDAVVLRTLSDQLGIAIKNATLYEEIRRANMKLTELDKLKSEFLGIVSHDFRSPLSSIILAGKSLLKHEAVQGVQRVREYLHIIVDQANRLSQLAEDTLSITKMESGHLSYYFKIVNVERLIQDAISMVRFSSRHSVTYYVDPDVAFIKGDQTKLRQVVQNLVSNAVKYSPRGGTVTVAATNHSPEQIQISVADQGMGIPPDQIEKLFKKFSRVNSGEAKDIKGAGLGLWICREVVGAHGGKIWIESESGKGTTVRLTINKAQQA